MDESEYKYFPVKFLVIILYFLAAVTLTIVFAGQDCLRCDGHPEGRGAALLPDCHTKVVVLLADYLPDRHPQQEGRAGQDWGAGWGPAERH